MPTPPRARYACPCTGIIDLIGKKWSLCIITALGNGGRLRFNAIGAALPGISPRTLADTLKGMTRAGLVARDVFAEVPPRVEYSLTADGAELLESVAPLMRWAERRRPTDGP